jgi:protein phosphatase
MLFDKQILANVALPFVRFPVCFEVFADQDVLVAVAHQVEGMTPRALPGHDALLLARALFTSVATLIQAGVTLGRIVPEDVVLQSNGTVVFRVAPELSLRHDSDREIDELHRLGALLEYFTEVPRITRKFDIADADVHPLLLILGDLRDGVLTSFVEVISRVEEALQPYERQQHMRVSIAAHTDVGRKRSSNEDSIFYQQMSWQRGNESHTVYMAIVADGMGGHAAGEVASRLAIQAMSEHLLAGQFVQLQDIGFGNDVAAVVQCIDDAVQYANTLVVKEAQRLQNDMGTTLAMVFGFNGLVYVVNVGDSRTYLWRNRTLRRITTDHSLVMKLVELEHIDEADIYTHPQRSGVLRSLGMSSGVQADIFVERLRPDDVLLVCSDGLWEMLRDAQITAMLKKSGSLQATTHALITGANQAGGDDNISAVMLHFALASESHS